MDSGQEEDKVEGMEMSLRTSGRKRKLPMSRSDDFLWTMDLVTKV
jgi:hypothetical protein